jgi:hypothetical protein
MSAFRAASPELISEALVCAARCLIYAEWESGSCLTGMLANEGFE